jgi:DNA-binding transcriptional LysR family regulator
MDRLVLRDLAVFETVARHRSFTAAAAELGVKQSSLSYAITQLGTRPQIDFSSADPLSA